MVVSDIQENNMATKKDMKKAMELLEEVSSDEVAKGPNVYLYHQNTLSVTITTGEVWYKRLWFLISSPLRYLFTGEWKF
jgi:hypothetical protein